MNISVKCAISTTLGKKYNPSRGPTEHRKIPFSSQSTKKGLLGIKMDIINIILQLTFDF